ncbi:MAG: glycosyltransferase family 2 protein [Chloroflexi bacterium]|nr:glycosyltransferase family 2 protein [Chloroflexota bacterium]
MSATPAVSVVIPCLNERETIAACVSKARRAFAELEIDGEVVVADNGSTDGSDEIAAAEGARVVRAVRKGYGNAYLVGFREAHGDVMVMGDADDTYDFSRLGDFLAPLREGYEFVNGSRLRGQILPGAMPWSHRYIGNPFLSWLLNLFFHTGFSDSYCGMRAFTREAYQRIQPRSVGMEFALEMIINAGKAQLRSTEIPIVYHPRLGESKLHTLKDGWRSLRFMLLYSPDHLFLLPGLAFLAVGSLVMALLLFATLSIAGHPLGNHSMLVGALLAILGVQILATGLLAKTYSLAERFERDDKLLAAFYRRFNLEKGLVLGGVLVVGGVLVYLVMLISWWRSGFGPLFQERPAIAALAAVVIGAQIIIASFFGSLLGLKRAELLETGAVPAPDPLPVS